jgi:hypothetical protein
MTLGYEADECAQIFLSDEFQLWCFIGKNLAALQDFPDACFFGTLHLWLLLFGIVNYCGSSSFFSFIGFGCLRRLKF